MVRSAKDPIRIGLAGLGRAGWSMHCSELKNYGDQFRIVAACDVSRQRRDLMKKTYGCRTCSSVAELVEDPEVELLDVATRTTEHVEHALLGLRAGKHVFLEKPIAVSYEEAKQLKPAARKAEGSLYIRHNRRFEPAFNHIREIISSGILGEVYTIKLRRHQYQRRDDWQTLMECGGGQLLNWGPHIIDHALRLLESPIQSLWSDLQRRAAVGDAEDHLKIVFRGKNKRVIDLEISGAVALPESEYLVLGSRGSLSAHGREIRMRYQDPEVKLPRRRAKKGTPVIGGGFGSREDIQWIEKTIEVAPGKPVKMDIIWDYLYQSIREGRPFPITLDQALEVMKVVSRVKRKTEFEQT